MKTLKTWVGIGIALGMLGAVANAVPPGTTDEIRARVQPFGALCRAGDDCGQASAAVASGPRTGEQVYGQFCFACHTTGVGGAPMFQDAAAWAPRIEQGLDTLWTHTQNGLNAMPPRGTCMDCSDDELRDAMQYMVDAVQPQ